VRPRVRAEALQRDRRILPAAGYGHAPRRARRCPQAVATRAGEGARWNARRLELGKISPRSDRNEGGHQELEHLRTSGAPAAEIDRRLALLAFRFRGLKEAASASRSCCRAAGNDTAQLYLA